LPTPCQYDYNSARTEMKWEEDKAKWKEKGVNLQMPLKQMTRFNMLPTPRANDMNHSTRIEQKSFQHRKNRSYMAEVVIDLTNPPSGKTSHLSPQFVMEMMGFPTDWTLLPFLNGEQNQSKQEETQ